MKPKILKSDDWEGLFLNDRLIDEGHQLGEGKGRLQHLQDLSREYNFSMNDIEEYYVVEEDDNYLYEYGSFPSDMSDLYGIYNLKPKQ